jgi:hypothetical protein
LDADVLLLQQLQESPSHLPSNVTAAYSGAVRVFNTNIIDSMAKDKFVRANDS